MDNRFDRAKDASLSGGLQIGGTTGAGAAVVPVSLLLGSARLIIERHLGLSWVSGEISNFTRAASGHCYFILKDERAQARCVLFRSKAQWLDVTLQDGLSVEVRATPTLYEARGEFQLNVDNVRLAGLGALYEKFARLKARLETAGWFRQERKRELPRYPRAVGIVTSLHSAALRDVLTTLRRRLPALSIILYPSAVQGGGAAADIAAAIAQANAHARVDVLIVCRGGGSIEDLWVFNEEVVAKAILESLIPIVSGVGHETDFTICDFVADARAATPTGAASLVAPDRMALLAAVDSLIARWVRATARGMELRMQRLDFASRRLIHPAARLAQQAGTLSGLAARLLRAGAASQARGRREVALLAQGLSRTLRAPLPQARRLDRAQERWRRAGGDHVADLARRVAALDQNMRHLNPLAVLERGYSIVTDVSGDIVQDATSLAAGDVLRLRMARGEAGAVVTSVDTPSPR